MYLFKVPFNLSRSGIIQKVMVSRQNKTQQKSSESDGWRAASVCLAKGGVKLWSSMEGVSTHGWLEELEGRWSYR